MILSENNINLLSFRMSIVKSAIDIIRNTDASLEMTVAWPHTVATKAEITKTVTAFAIVWKYVDKQAEEYPQWTVTQMESTLKSWLEVKNNTIVCPKMKKHSIKLFSALIFYCWSKCFDINAIKRFEKAWIKGAHDIEAFHLAGFLKFAYLQKIVAVDPVEIDGITRKNTAQYLKCHVLLVIRNKASSLDVTNFYEITNQINQKVIYSLIISGHRLNSFYGLIEPYGL